MRKNQLHIDHGEDTEVRRGLIETSPGLEDTGGLSFACSKQAKISFDDYLNKPVTQSFTEKTQRYTEV